MRVPRPLPAELAEGQVAAVKRAQERLLDDLRMVVERNRIEPPDRRGSRVVDPDVDPAVAGRGFTSELGDVDRIRHVRFHREGSRAFGDARAGHLVEIFAAARCQYEDGAGARERHRRTAAEFAPWRR